MADCPHHTARSQAINQILAKPSGSPDGLTSAEAAPGSAIKPQSGLIGDLLYQAKNGSLGHAARTITEGLVQMPSAENPLDDRKLLLEHGVGLLQHLPPVRLVLRGWRRRRTRRDRAHQTYPQNSSTGKKIAQDFIGVCFALLPSLRASTSRVLTCCRKMLWNDLPHPPASYVGPEATYRKADGSGNNPLLPDLGKAGTPCKPQCARHRLPGLTGLTSFQMHGALLQSVRSNLCTV